MPQSIRRELELWKGAVMPRLLDGFELSRRRWLQAGGLGMLGLGLSDLARLRGTVALNAAQDKGRRRSCVFLFLFGGPSHIDLWDMKPDAPEIVRGEFSPIDTIAVSYTHLTLPTIYSV